MPLKDASCVGLDTGSIEAEAHGASPHSDGRMAQFEDRYVPGGLLGDTKAFFFQAAPRPVDELAEAGAISFLAGLCGNAYSINSTGLNQYIVCVAPTGAGKEAIASGTSKLVKATWASPEPYPHGSVELISSAGLIKRLAKQPCHANIVGEFDKKLRDWINPRNPNGYQLGRSILQLYSKSGPTDYFDPMAYSDPDKVTHRIDSPSLTLIGECTNDGFYELLGDGVINDGLLPRFMVYEYQGPRGYYNKASKDAVPDAGLVQRLKDFRAQCESIRSTAGSYEVPLTAEAEAKFDEFDRWTTDAINGGNEVTKQLWNRAHLKALKLAALAAVSDNWLAPTITLAQAIWATNKLAEQTYRLISRFANGEVGEETGNENKQLAHMKRIIAELFANQLSSERLQNYRVNIHLLNNGIIEHSYLHRRLATLPAFAPKPKAAIKDTIKLMMDNGWLAYCSTEKRVELGTRATCYLMANPTEFADLPFIKDQSAFVMSYISLLRF